MTDQHRVWSVTKTIQDNDMIKGTGIVYVENDIELSVLIGSSVVYDENQIRQWRDRL